MEPIKRVSLYEQVIDAIQDMLRQGQFQVGDRLPTEHELAASLGVSRNSVREALKALAIAGVVEAIPGRGTFVRPEAAEAVLQPDGLSKLMRHISIEELIEVRKILEGEAAALAAKRATDEDIEEFRHTWDELHQALATKGNINEAGYKHHQAIAGLSGNRLLIRLIESIAEELKAFRRVLITLPYPEDEQYLEHEQIFQAIINHDPNAARAAMRHHLEYVEKLIKKAKKKATN